MKSLLQVIGLTVVLLASGAAIAGEAVPIHATFGLAWMRVDWTNPEDRITEALGAAGLPNGRTIGLMTRDHLNSVTGEISSDYATLTFSATDKVYLQYVNLPARYDPVTQTASFGGPLQVVGGEGKFRGATGTLTLRARVQFYLPIATNSIDGVIKTAD